jgi:hypothetical protein
MGFLHDKRSPFDFPPGVPPGQRGREERDQFGLLINWSFLCGTIHEFNERMAATEAFAKDAADAVRSDDPTYVAQLEPIFDGMRKAGVPEE